MLIGSSFIPLWRTCDVILSYLLVEVMNRSALFCIVCNVFFAVVKRMFRRIGGYVRIDLT